VQQTDQPTDALRAHLLDIARAAIAAADPATAIRRHVHRDGAGLRISGTVVPVPADVRMIAAGKAAVPMAAALLNLLGELCIPRGVIVTKHGNAHGALPLPIIEAGHPVPDDASLRAGAAVCAALEGCSADTLVLTCVSGGASALLVAPQPGISLKTVIAINDVLLRSGVDIGEMNAVRSRIDRLKAGGLVRLARPGRVIGLILSDVIGDPLHVIASGLTHDPAAHNVLVGNNTQACEAAAQLARAMGFAARIVTTALHGEARDAGSRIAADIAAAAAGTALVYGGETTVTLRGTGKGGRNQELALAAALALEPHAGCAVLALGTDGTDGPTNAAGALAFKDTLERARAQNVDAHAALDNNASFTFFQSLGDLLITGPTGTNVADVVVAIKA
jgi:hydroxypyruvate reductase